MRALAISLLLLAVVTSCASSQGSSNSTDSMSSAAAKPRSIPRVLATPGTGGSARLVKAPMQVVSGRSGGPEGYVEVTIHGKPFLFLVDSGAAETVIEARVVAELHLRVFGPTKPAAMVGCTRPYRPVEIDGWAIGSDRLPTGIVTSIDLQSPNRTLNGLPLGGLLGQDLFDTYGTLTLDFVTRAMTLGGPAPSPGNRVSLNIRRSRGAVSSTTTVTINGQAETMVPDTGTTRTLLDTKVADQLNLPASGPSTRRGSGACSTVAIATVFDNWSAGSVHLPKVIGERLITGFSQTGAKSPAVKGILGTDVLATFGTLTIDYHGNQLLLGP